ncbi:MAG TPA: cupredoxin domain-containing protein [Candidatus Eisenbacteria bacterium]|nr:cupredoxin domain-containing protein [Candidatus Eisenbacteria bacterium]
MRASRPWLAPLGFLLVAVLASGCASSSGLQGRLDASSGHHSRTTFRDTVVYLVSESPESVATGRPTAAMAANRSGFHPSVLAVAAGTRVEFRNNDDVFHQFFSVSPAQTFDVGAVSPGEKRYVIFDHPGEVHVFCALHPKESAFVYVTPTRRFARVDDQGRFHFWGLEPGSYTLRTWHPERGETSQAVVVPRHATVQVTLTN